MRYYLQRIFRVLEKLFTFDVLCAIFGVIWLYNTYTILDSHKISCVYDKFNWLWKFGFLLSLPGGAWFIVTPLLIHHYNKLLGKWLPSGAWNDMKLIVTTDFIPHREMLTVAREIMSQSLYDLQTEEAVTLATHAAKMVKIWDEKIKCADTPYLKKFAKKVRRAAKEEHKMWVVAVKAPPSYDDRVWKLNCGLDAKRRLTRLAYQAHVKADALNEKTLVAWQAVDEKYPDFSAFDWEEGDWREHVIGYFINPEALSWMVFTAQITYQDIDDLDPEEEYEFYHKVSFSIHEQYDQLRLPLMREVAAHGRDFVFVEDYYHLFLFPDGTYDDRWAERARERQLEMALRNDAWIGYYFEFPDEINNPFPSTPHASPWNTPEQNRLPWFMFALLGMVVDDSVTALISLFASCDTFNFMSTPEFLSSFFILGSTTLKNPFTSSLVQPPHRGLHGTSWVPGEGGRDLDQEQRAENIKELLDESLPGVIDCLEYLTYPLLRVRWGCLPASLGLPEPEPEPKTPAENALERGYFALADLNIPKFVKLPQSRYVLPPDALDVPGAEKRPNLLRAWLEARIKYNDKLVSKNKNYRECYNYYLMTQPMKQLVALDKKHEQKLPVFVIEADMIDQLIMHYKDTKETDPKYASVVALLKQTRDAFLPLAMEHQELYVDYLTKLGEILERSLQIAAYGDQPGRAWGQPEFKFVTAGRVDFMHQATLQGLGQAKGLLLTLQEMSAEVKGEPKKALPVLTNTDPGTFAPKGLPKDWKQRIGGPPKVGEFVPSFGLRKKKDPEEKFSFWPASDMFALLLETDSVVDSRYNLLFILAISSIGAYCLILAGWSSNSKYAFIGGLRSAAQVISYEVVISVVLLPIIMASGAVGVTEAVFVQMQTLWFLGLLVADSGSFATAMLAETNRTPFDLPEAEAELVAGYNVDYSSMPFALFFLGEYSNMILIGTLFILLFIGGWVFIVFVHPLILTSKAVWIWLFFVIVRATTPRYRYDQLMGIGWQALLPFTSGFLFFTVGIAVCFAVAPVVPELKYVSTHVDLLISNH